jgi:hypothetical protein
MRNWGIESGGWGNMAIYSRGCISVGENWGGSRVVLN